MKTISALLQDYAEARTSVHELAHAGYAASDLDLIVLASTVDNYAGSTPAREEPDTAERFGGEAARLEGLLAGRLPMPVPDIGRAYVVGETATMVAKVAMRPGLAESALPVAFSDIGVPPEAARAYNEGVRRGGLLLWLDVSDEQTGPVADLLRLRHGEYVGSYMDAVGSLAASRRSARGA